MLPHGRLQGGARRVYFDTVMRDNGRLSKQDPCSPGVGDIIAPLPAWHLREARSSRSSPPCRPTLECTFPHSLRPVRACPVPPSNCRSLTSASHCRSPTHLRPLARRRSASKISTAPTSLSPHCTTPTATMADADMEANIDLLLSFGADQLDRNEARQLLAVWPKQPATCLRLATKP
jgi:hypothetical protein